MRRRAAALVLALLAAGCRASGRPEAAGPEPETRPPVSGENGRAAPDSPAPGTPPAAPPPVSPGTPPAGKPRSPAEDQAMATALAFHEALWRGDRAAAEGLLADGAEPLGNSLRQGSRYADFGSSWADLLWESQGIRRREREDAPRVEVGREGAPLVHVRFCTREDGERWCYTESVQVESGRVAGFYREAVPYHRDGGARPGYRVAVTDLGPVLRIGPFYRFLPDRAVHWAAGGSMLAIHAGGLAGDEVWVLDAGGGLTLAWQAERPLGDWAWDARVLGWQGDRLWILNTAAHAGDSGSGGAPGDGPGRWALVTLSHPGGELRTVATGEHGGLWRGDGWMTADGRWAAFWSIPHFWRADLATGQVERLSDRIPSWDGLFWMHPSPDGRHVAWVEPWTGTVHLVDVAAGAHRQWSAGTGWAEFRGWAGPGRLIVAAGAESGTWDAVDWTLLLAADAVRIYTPEGEVVQVILPPDGTHIGPGAWQGARYAFVTGRMEGGWRDDLIPPPFHAGALWLADGQEVRKLADLGSRAVEHVEWQDGTVRVWWHRGPQREGRYPDRQEGVRVDPATGRTEPVRRSLGVPTAGGVLRRWPDGTRLEERAAGDTFAVVLAGPDGERVLHEGFVRARRSEPVPPGAAAVIVEDFGLEQSWVYVPKPASWAAGRGP